MKETEYLDSIKKALSDPGFLGDDCAFLPASLIGENGFFVTQDSLVEDVHFKKDFISPYQLGKKAVNVNLSDLAAMCSKPLVLTISLSLPKNIEEAFVSDFYKGVNEVCIKHDVKVAGGDLTGSDKIFISVCAIGASACPYIVSRKFAKPGDVIVTTGFHGDSAGGLKLLCCNQKSPAGLINAHLNPQAQLEKSRYISQKSNRNFAMMDTSDGLADALYKLSKDSGVTMVIDFDKVPVSDDLKNTFPEEYRNMVLWGGEDYQLLFCIGKDVYETLDKNLFYKIGVVEDSKNAENLQDNCIVKIYDNGSMYIIDENTFNTKSFNHFERQNKDEI